MSGDQKGFLGAIILLLLLVVVAPIAYLMLIFAVAEYSRPSIESINAIDGKPVPDALSLLKAMGFDCTSDEDQPTRNSWTCGADEATIAGPCHWKISFVTAAGGNVTKPEVLLAEGQCKR